VTSFLRRFVSRIPAQWRGAVLLAGFTLLFPLWVTLVVWDAVLGKEARVSAGVEASATEP
jgi:hypothetical protein